MDDRSPSVEFEAFGPSAGYVQSEDPWRRRLGPLGRWVPATQAEIHPRTFFEVARRLSVGRSLYWSWRCKGRFLVARGSHVSVPHSARIVLAPGAWLLVGFHHRSSNPALIDMGRDALIEVKGTVQVWRGAQLMVYKGGHLEMGDRVIFNEGSRVVCMKHVRFGDASGMSWNSSVVDSDMHHMATEGVWKAPHAPVLIGDHTLIGAGSTVVKGVTLGSNVIVGAGAVVTKDVPNGCMVVGNPARVVRTNAEWR